MVHGFIKMKTDGKNKHETNSVLLLLLLLHLLDHSRCNCEKLRFHNNGIVMMNLSVTAALGSGCTQPSLEYPEYPEFNVHLILSAFPL